MSIKDVRRAMRAFLNQNAPTGPDVIQPLESLAFLATEDLEFQNKHVLRELTDFLDTTAAIHSYVEDRTVGDHAEFQKYWQQLYKDPNYKPTSDLRVEGGAIIALNKNLKVAVAAYERLAEDVALSHTEQTDLVRDVQHLPELLQQLSSHYAAEAIDGDLPTQKRLQISNYRDGAAALSKAVAEQLKGLDGPRRGGGRHNPEHN